MMLSLHRLNKGIEAARFLGREIGKALASRESLPPSLRELSARGEEDGFRRLCGSHVETKSPAELFPGIEDEEITCFAEARIFLQNTFVRGGSSLLLPREIFFLSALARHLDIGRAFEFGTFRGGTAYLFALNSGPAARIFTLDRQVRPDRIDLRRQDPAMAKITFLEGDSRTFSVDPYIGTCDLVLIDGNHEAAWVEQDTENAFRLLNDTGTVVWHDFTPRWQGVVKTVWKVARAMTVYRVEHTWLAIHTRRRTPVTGRPPVGGRA